MGHYNEIFQKRAKKPQKDRRGWVPVNLPPQIRMFTQMHLTQEQVKALLPTLQHFAETGELPS